MTPSPPLCMVSLPIKFTDDFLISTFMVLFLLLVIIFIFIFFFFFFFFFLHISRSSWLLEVLEPFGSKSWG